MDDRAGHAVAAYQPATQQVLAREQAAAGAAALRYAARAGAHTACVFVRTGALVYMCVCACVCVRVCCPVACRSCCLHVCLHVRVRPVACQTCWCMSMRCLQRACISMCTRGRVRVCMCARACVRACMCVHVCTPSCVCPWLLTCRAGACAARPADARVRPVAPPPWAPLRLKMPSAPDRRPALVCVCMGGGRGKSWGE